MRKMIFSAILAACTTALSQESTHAHEWVLMGTVDGTLQCLTSDPKSDELFAGTYSQGVLRSTDEGETWTQMKSGWNVTSMTIQRNSWGNRLYISNQNGGYYLHIGGEQVWSMTGLVSEKIPAFSFFKGWIFIGDTDGISRSNASESGQDDGWTRELEGKNIIGLTTDGEKFFAMTKKEIWQREEQTRGGRGGNATWKKVASLKNKSDFFSSMAADSERVFAATSFGIIQYDRTQKWSYFKTGTTEKEVVALTIWDNQTTGEKHLIAAMKSGLIYRSGPL